MHSVSTHLIIAKVEEFPSQALHSSARGQGVHVLLPAAPPHRRQPEAGLRFRADSAASPLQPPAGKEPRAKGRGQATCGFLGPPDLGWMQWTELRRQLCGPEPNASRLWWTPGCPPWHAGLSSTFSWAMLLRRAPRPHPRASRASGAVGLGQARRPRTGAVTAPGCVLVLPRGAARRFLHGAESAGRDLLSWASGTPPLPGCARKIVFPGRAPGPWTAETSGPMDEVNSREASALGIKPGTRTSAATQLQGRRPCHRHLSGLQFVDPRDSRATAWCWVE